MRNSGQKDISLIFREGAEIDQAIQDAARDAIRRHRQSGQPIPMWRDGQIVLVTPDELEEHLTQHVEQLG